MLYKSCICKNSLCVILHIMLFFAIAWFGEGTELGNSVNETTCLIDNGHTSFIAWQTDNITCNNTYNWYSNNSRKQNSLQYNNGVITLWGS